MSFISNVKLELINKTKKTLNKKDSLSFLYGLFKSSCEINLNANEINFFSSSSDLLILINTALKSLNLEEAELELDDEKIFKNNSKYKINLNKKTSEHLLNEFIYKNDFVFCEHLINTVEQKTLFIKALFLTTATGNLKLNSEDSGYLIEFVLSDNNLSLELTNLLAEFDIFAKKVERRGQFVVYLNKFDLICDLLALVGANNSVFELNNENIIRSMRNNINRQNNCLEANISKTISASLKQLEAINFIDQTIGISSLDESLQQVCLLRLANKEESLDNLVKLMNGTISKSGLNHRFNKILKIAKELKDR